MLVQEEYVDLDVGTSSKMRVHLFLPVIEGQVQLGAVCAFSEIYQVTGPVERFCRFLAAHIGLIVAAPEVYHEFEPAGTQLAYDVAGTERGNALKREKTVQAFDHDAKVLVEYLRQRSDCNGRIGSAGMCLGGHLAFRCALVPGVTAAACLFATDLHQGSLGDGDDSLQRCHELAQEGKELLMVWGKQDNHVPPEGRRLIYDRLHETGVDFAWCELNARHAFIRDELSKGRYDPALTGVVHQLISELFHRRLVLGVTSTAMVTAQTSAPGPSHC